MQRDPIPDPTLSADWFSWATKLREFLSFERRNRQIRRYADDTEYLIEDLIINDKPVYFKTFSLIVGPNGAPGVPAFKNTAHGITNLDIFGYLTLEGVYSTTAGGGIAFPSAHDNFIFALNSVFYIQGANITWATDWNATPYSAKLFMEYQKT